MGNKLKIGILVLCLIIIYGFYEKNRRANLLIDFRNNKEIQCDNLTIKRSHGWFIHNNRFFSNGKIAKTIIFCKKKD